MKKFTMIAALALMTALPLFAEHVDPETAHKVATSFLNNNGAKAAQLTDLSQAAGFSNLYIFTANEGFVVMAADDCVKPILGYSLTGKFVAEGMPENVYYWLKGYDEQIADAIESKQMASLETSKQWSDLLAGKGLEPKSGKSVEALIQTHWAQGTPYNNLCPSGSVTGCVATAMAQIMKFWNYPTRGIGSHDYQYSPYGTLSAHFGATNYDWANMTNTYSSSSTAAQNAAVATLMYHCGVSVEMKYSPSESGSNTKRSSVSMGTYFNYSTSYIEKKNFSDEKWSDTLKYELDQRRPILYAGSGNKGGHAFVCDGYDNNGLFHFNWGWGGSSDGYFSINSLTPGSYNFSSNQSAVINIKPLTKSILPIVLTLGQTEGVIDLNWTDSQSSISYNIYRNDALIATSNEATYTDSEPAFGANVYYVRGMKNDTLSLPSNCESFTIDYPTPIVNDLNASVIGNDASLSWNAPEWCFPSSANIGSFSYVNENRLDTDNWYSWDEGEFTLSWGQRFPSSLLASYVGKILFEISFYSNKPGAFDIIVYQGIAEGKPAEIIAIQSITTARVGWSRVPLGTPVDIPENEDLWIFVRNTDYKVHEINFKSTVGVTEGCYYAGSNPMDTCASIGEELSWLICPYLTDGTYTYNLYQDGVKIGENLSDTHYTASLNDNAANLFTVKTNYYGGEAPSNMVGFAKGNTSLSSLELDVNDKMTLTEGSILTVSDTLSNSNPDKLIIEDGAQLIHNAGNVKATVKKSIAAYTSDNDGWNFIASPVVENITPNTENGLLNGTIGEGNNTYDLYYYDEPTRLWKNYESAPFNLEHKKGYLYSNGTATTLQFAGTLQPSNSTESISGLSHSASTLNGFNLVGNPFVCNATIDQDCYVIDGNHVILADYAKVFAPCEGAFVKAASDEYTVTFTKSVGSKGNHPKDCFDLVVTQGKANVDRARVRMGEGIGMEKVNLDGDNGSQLTLWHDGQDYAVIYADGLKELPVNFKATKDSTYTIGIEANSLCLGYLHLIDNMTGADIDLLAMPSYTFEAKTTDYASRFRLVFNATTNGPSTGSGSFAYYANGEIRMVESYQGTSLQVVDIMGRVIASYNGRIQCVPTAGMTPGVYVLRLINGENIRTQKIVIE